MDRELIIQHMISNFSKDNVSPFIEIYLELYWEFFYINKRNPEKVIALIDELKDCSMKAMNLK